MSASKRKRGRPTVYTPAIGGELCERLADGESLDAICRDPYMPSAPTVRRWVLEGIEGENGALTFSAEYARARGIAFERMAEEIILYQRSGLQVTGSSSR